MANLDIPHFDEKKKLFAFLKENKQLLTAQKKNAVKLADTVPFAAAPGYTGKATAIKAQSNEGVLQVKAVINTTNVMDSHLDVHLPGIWDKSLKENKLIMHVQEHQSQSFDKIIASGQDLKATAETYSWKELGYDVEGKTQALVFDSTIKRERNAYMYDQYAKGYVTNHSVGMRYVKLFMGINDKDYPEENQIWEKYIDQVVNRKEAESVGYAWFVTEAKAIEGSAVPLGSNSITPTLSVGKNIEPPKGTQQQEAAKALQNHLLMFNF